MRVRTVLAAAATLVLSTLLAAPPAAADPGLTEPVKCILGPQIPETPAYYIIWYCTVGDAVPEPLDRLGCHITFPLGLDCVGAEIPQCQVTAIPEEPVQCDPDPRDNCILSYPASELCQGDVVGFVLYFVGPLTEATASVAGLPPAPEPVQCILGPHIPETPAYYIVWYCTVGDAVPEPIEFLTGCTFGFPITDISCLPPPQCLVAEPPGPECDIEPGGVVGDVLGSVAPGEPQCLQVYPASELCEGDVVGFLEAVTGPLAPQVPDCEVTTIPEEPIRCG